MCPGRSLLMRQVSMIQREIERKTERERQRKKNRHTEIGTRQKQTYRDRDVHLDT